MDGTQPDLTEFAARLRASSDALLATAMKVARTAGAPADQLRSLSADLLALAITVAQDLGDFQAAGQDPGLTGSRAVLARAAQVAADAYETMLVTAMLAGIEEAVSEEISTQRG